MKSNCRRKVPSGFSVSGGNHEPVTLVIPCYNEDANLDRVLPDVIAYCRRNDYLLILVDDGSKDGTAEKLAQYTDPLLKVCRHKCNRGYGTALKTGLGQVQTPWAVTIDADGQHRLEDVDRPFERAFTAPSANG